MNWIWMKEKNPNSFGEFQTSFFYAGGKAELAISASWRYAAYINGTFVSNGQYADLPEYKCVNQADITPFVQEGENTLTVIAWHLGADYSVCRTMEPSVAFQVTVDGKLAAQSGPDTLCRRAWGYRAGAMVSAQMGPGFHYDFTAAQAPWEPAQPVQAGFSEVPRPILQTQVGQPLGAKVTAQGVFQYRGGETAAEKMQYAWMAPMEFSAMTGKARVGSDGLDQPLAFHGQGGDGLYVLVDLGKETCGHLSVKLSVPSACKLLLGWGEHLADLRLRTAVGGRNFAMEISLEAGENCLDDYLLRLGCRYLCIFAETDRLTLQRLSIREVGYPFRFPEKAFPDGLDRAIYETGRRTLYLCAHEHYEDCPWREQALYGMDSRNQILFGYGAFEEYEFPRANLMLIARSMNPDGLIPLTAPAQMSITIPAFTAYWLIAVGENAQADYRADFAQQVMPYVDRAMTRLLAQKGNLFTQTPYWNFHEWSQGLDGGEIFRQQALEEGQDACLTALTALAARSIAQLKEKAGDLAQARSLEEAARELTAMLEDFYDPASGFYSSYRKADKRHGRHAYTQALVLCCGGVPEERAQKLCKALIAPEDSGLVPATFSSLQMQYQALIQYGHLEHCVEEVRSIFGSMLLNGATSYWETALGEADFEDAGSLCHGWSAVCCWVLDQYYK